MWFVIHVKPGTEAQAVEMLKSADRGSGLEEVFCPMAKSVRREHGEMVDACQPLLKGCVFAIAASKWELRACMRRTEGIEALYDRDRRPSFGVLEDAEVAFIDLLAKPGERVVEASDAVMGRNGRVTVQRGPLLGRESEIRRHSEKRRWAYLNTRVAGEPAVAQVGLWVTREDDAHPRQRFGRGERRR